MNTLTHAVTGEVFAADLRSETQRLGLLAVVTVRYLPTRGRIRLAWVHGNEAIDVPATPEWAGRIREALPLYAGARRLATKKEI